MKKITAIYFSPTEGTRKYTETVARALDGDFQAIDLTDSAARKKEYSFGPDDLVIFGAPVYAGRLPLLEEPLYGHIRGDQTPAVFTVTYGNRAYDDALLEMKDFCEAQGFIGIGAAAFLAQHTYSEQLAGGRPTETDLAEAADFAGRLKGLAENRSIEAGELPVPGNRPYKEAKHLPMQTEASERCSECGLCAKNCPTGAIRDGAGMEADMTVCIGCLRCVKRCPRKARIVNDPGLFAIREKLEPAFGGIHKNAEYFVIEKNK